MRVLEALRSRVEELEKELKAATDALAIKNSEMEHVRSVGLRMLHVAGDVVSCNRGEGRYISEKTNDDPLYADAGFDLVGDDYDNFSPWAHGFWSGALATARLLYLPASIENWEEDGYYTDFGDEIDFEVFFMPFDSGILICVAPGLRPAPARRPPDLPLAPAIEARE